MGSESDWAVMQHAVQMLEEFGVPYEARVVSAHRTPDDMFSYAKTAASRGLQLIIAGAGGAAHLPGMIASKTMLPVLGVPVTSRSLGGLDSLLSIAQMPKGIPVATFAVGEAGAANAALFAIAVLANDNATLARKLSAFRTRQRARVKAMKLPAVKKTAAARKEMIGPGAWLGLLGGGQLGRMFTMAAQSMGYKVMVLDPGSDSPAGSVADEHVQADYTDSKALAQVAGRCAAATTEFENVPAESLRMLSEHCVVSPAASSVAIAQDRIREKSTLRDYGFSVAPFAVIRSRADLADPEIESLLPGILKVSRFGYDGKGQIRVASRDSLEDAFDKLQQEACVLEKFLPLETELSVVVARGFGGDVVTFPVSENQHVGGILDISIAPSRVSGDIARQVSQTAIDLSKRLDYRGVLCVEYFVVDRGRIVVNEIAPRPHNSGHYTIDACSTSQFEQQVRVMCSLPLGETAMFCPAVMLNLLGDVWAAGEPQWDKVLRYPGAKLHLYGKSTPRPGRKMGHVTILSEQVETALDTANEIKSILVADAGNNTKARSA